MKLLVTGAAGFIGSTYVRLVGDEHEVRVLDKLTYAGRRENLPEGTELIEGAIEDPEIVREAMEGCDAVVNFAAESHVDRSIDDQDAFARTHVIGTGILLDAARELGVGRYLQVSTDEVYGSIESGSFTETSPLDPSSPYSATKAAGDLLVSAHFHTYGLEAVDLSRLQQLRPAPVPREADPADGAQRDPRRLAADLRRRPSGPQLALRRGLLSRHPHGAGEGSSRRGLQRRRPRRVREHRGGQAGDRADRRRRVADRVRQGPARPRPPLLALHRDKIREQLGWEAQVRFADGLERTVQWYRDNEDWWGPIRSGEYREYYEKQYGKALG